MSDSGLSAPQEEAVTHVEGPLLVLAGAGSGKTRVITHRIAHLIRMGVPPDKILALSFTNKAAREVGERVRGLAGGRRTAGLTVSTFHALGLQILREDIGRLGFARRFTLHTESDQRALVRQIVRDAGLPWEPLQVQARISLWKNRGLSPRDVVAEGATGSEPRALLEAYAAYEALLRAQAAVDFDDLLLLPLHLFREHRDCLHHWQGVFHFLLVDEYQDTNPVQFELLRALSGTRRNLCVVGDDDQSIYGWRGAEVELILAFEKHFPGARVVLLDENYRSTDTILRAAHAVVAPIAGRRPKRLWTRRGAGEPLGWIDAEDAAGEAEEVVNAVLADRFRRQRPWSDFAVLYRTNAQSRPFEAALRAHGIPHRVVGGARFFDRKEVRDLLGYLKAVHNPRDDASLMRIANVPKRGLGPRSLLQLRERAASRGGTLCQALAEAESLAPQARSGARALLGLLETYRRRFHAEGLSPEGVGDLIHDAGLRAEVEATYQSPATVRRRMELLEELAASVADAPRVAGKIDLALFIERLSLDPPEERDDETEDALTLMTLHSAKGLEFPVVFLTGMEEGLLPHARREGAAAAGESDLDEERRLCYVGMTRARERLVLSRARTRRHRGVARAAPPSRFLTELPLSLTAGETEHGAATVAEERELARNFFQGVRSLLD